MRTISPFLFLLDTITSKQDDCAIFSPDTGQGQVIIDYGEQETEFPHNRC
jgi:hypothetical protein